MSINFRVADLIKAAEAAIKSENEQVAAREKAIDAEYNGQITEWMKKHKSTVVAVRNYLSECIKANKAPLASELKHHADVDRRGSYGYLSDISLERKSRNTIANSGRYPAIKRKTEDYNALIALLKASSDETVNANQLKLIGFKNLTELFQAVSLGAGK